MRTDSLLWGAIGAAAAWWVLSGGFLQQPRQPGLPQGNTPAYTEQAAVYETQTYNPQAYNSQTQAETQYLEQLIAEIADVVAEMKAEFQEREQPETRAEPDWMGIEQPPAPAKTPEELVKGIPKVSAVDAVPGDIMINGNSAATLMRDGFTLPFGGNPVAALMSLTERPDLAVFVWPDKIQPGDIYVINGEAFTMLTDGYSLVYANPTGCEYIQTPDVSNATAVIRMRAGDVPTDTQGLRTADVILRIRPDVEKRAPIFVSTETWVPAPTTIPEQSPTQTKAPAPKPTDAPAPTKTPAPTYTRAPTKAPSPTTANTPTIDWEPSGDVVTNTSAPTRTPTPTKTPTNTPTPTPTKTPANIPTPTYNVRVLRPNITNPRSTKTGG